MRVAYDQAAGTAYIYLKTDIGPGEVAATYECDLSQLGQDYGVKPIKGSVHLDFDQQGHLVGIEILGPKEILPSETLALAKEEA